MIPLTRLAAQSRDPAHVVAIRDGQRLTWGQFCAEVGGVAREMAGRRSAALLCDDSWRFAVGLFGLLAAGVPSVVVPSNDRPNNVAALAGSVERVVDDSLVPCRGEWTQGLAQGGTVLCFQTSGSTGSAKLVERGLARLDEEIAALHSLWGDDLAASPVLSTVPHQHAYGLAFTLLWPLAAGNPFLVRRYDAWEDVWADMQSQALLVTGPAHLTRLGGLPPLPGAKQPRMILSAGAPLPEAAAQAAWDLLGAPVTEIYGSTETGAVAARRRDGGDSPWQALPGYGVRRSESGLLRLTTPGGETEIADRIEESPDGGFRLYGRADRIAKIEGKRVSLDEVEQSLRVLPEIEDVAVLVLAGVLAAVAQPSAAGWDELHERGAFRFGRLLRRRLAAGLESAAQPRRWRFVTALPMSPMGKRRVDDLAALFTEPENV